MAMESIRIRGARVHNLKNIDLTVPRDKLVVFTGLSGSGKSSLAFDTLHAEGHRRFVESLSSYARMFLGQMDKPDVDLIEGLSPSISIDQKTTSHNPRSTVGTVTEIYDYFRLLYARIGVPHCPVCGKEIRQTSLDQIIDRIMTLPEGTRFSVLAPVVRGQKGMHEKVFADARRSGYVRVRVDGSVYDLSEDISLDKNLKHNVDVVLDRLVMKPDIRVRLSDSVQTALRLSDGRVTVATSPREGEGEEIEFSQKYACEEHNVSFGELEPRMFSFNNPFGACEECAGLGERHVLSEDRVIPRRDLSLRQGAIAVNGFKTMEEDGWGGPLYAAVLREFGVDLDTPIADYPPEALHALLYGTGRRAYEVVRYFEKVEHRQKVDFPGVFATIERRMRMGMGSREYYDEFYDDAPCPKCGGARLSEGMLAVTVGGLNIHEVCSLSVKELLDFMQRLRLTPEEETIAKEIRKEINARLGFLCAVGLEYLTLSRKAGTLSGGEAQRIRLATQIGSALVGVLYILDEPSIGLHQRDNSRLIATLKSLRDIGNTVIVVEHDEETMREADFLVDIGPGAGIHGGQVVACGTPAEIAACTDSLTGDYLSGRRTIPVPASRRAGNGNFLEVRGARENNLKSVNVSIPLGTFTCVTGVSGSGKSSLINGVLLKTLLRELNRALTAPGKCDAILGMEHLDKVIDIDQSPIGRTPRSNPATYTGLFGDIRELYAKVPESRSRGYTSGRFSFNVKGGRCEACEGDGLKRIEMHFLPDVYVKCDVCGGKRYNRDTLDIRYKGKNISEVLEMTVEEGLSFFDGQPKIRRKLEALFDVGLGYIKIGQPSTTMSGGEAQRVKLATELSRRPTGRTVYVLDEPTTGLHTHDVAKLIEILQRLADAGNTVIVIEHNLDLIKCADYILDMGPEGGAAGGCLIAEGTPEEVAQNPRSHTGRYLAEKLGLVREAEQNGQTTADETGEQQ